MTLVYFVRHGQSTYNDLGKMAGYHDPPLSMQGRAEAFAAAEFLRDVPFVRAYSSTLQRAVETASVIWGQRPGAPTQTRELCELDMGVFSGCSWTEVKRKHPHLVNGHNGAFWPLFSRDRIPGQEPFKSAVDRIMAFFNQLSRSSAPSPVLVVAHKGVLELFLSQTIGYDPGTDFFEVNGASVSVFEIKRDRSPKFHCINYVPGHLATVYSTSHLYEDRELRSA